MRRVTVLVFALCLVAVTAADLPTCGTACTTNGDCVLSQDGCSVCRSGKCSQQCGAQCNKDSDCGLIPGDRAAAEFTSSQCFVCYFNQCGSQNCGAQCSSDSECAPNPLCKVCTQGACSPPPTPQPSVPPTPQPPTPPPTPAPGKAAWGAITCATSCGTGSSFNYGESLAQAETMALATTPTTEGIPTVNFTWTQPLPCAAQVLSGSFEAYFVNSTDLGTASTQAVSNCRAANHSQCFLSVAACAIFPPEGSRWGGIATQGYPESTGPITITTNNGTGFDTWQDAMNATMNDCQSSSNVTCGLTAVWYNCMAFATSPGELAAASVNFANSLSAAKKAAIQSCTFEAEGLNCTIAAAACIAPFHESNDHTVTGVRAWRFNTNWSEKVKKNY